MQPGGKLTALARTVAAALCALSAGLSVHAAGPTSGAALVRLHTQDRAVERVGFRLATANVGLCPRPAYDPGFSIHTLEQYGPAYRPAAAGLFGLGDHVGVLAVAPGSPAELAGLREGDALVAVDGAPLPPPGPSPDHADFTRAGRGQHLLQSAFGEAGARLAVLRGAAVLDLTIRGVPACASLFQVAPDALMNGAADGDYVEVSEALAALARDDDELAAALGHELAHNVLGHRARLDALHVARGAGAYFGRNARLIRSSETEADRLSVYLMARAGYDPAKAAPFLARVAAAYPLDFDPTHPAWRRRIQTVQREAGRIRAAGGDAAPPPDLARLAIQR